MIEEEYSKLEQAKTHFEESFKKANEENEQYKAENARLAEFVKETESILKAALDEREELEIVFENERNSFVSKI